MVVNLADKSTTVFNGFEFLNVFSEGDKLFGVKADGIYEILGDTDGGRPIEVEVLYGALTSDSYHNKRIRSFYADGVFGQELTGLVKFDGLEQLEYPYTFRCVPGKGAVGTSVSLGFKGYAPVLLESYSFTVETLARRRS